MKFVFAVGVALLSVTAFAASEKKTEDPRFTYAMAVAEFQDARLPVGKEVEGDWIYLGHAKEGQSTYYPNGHWMDENTLRQYLFRIRQLVDYPPGVARYEVLGVRLDLDAGTEKVEETNKASATETGIVTPGPTHEFGEGKKAYKCKIDRECRISKDQSKLICQWEVTNRRECLEYWGLSQKSYRLQMRR